MKRKNSVTIRDVAIKAGVSTQTVSRVWNNRPDVAPETFRRVRRIIAEMGYAPNMLARGLIHGRSYTLGVAAYGLHFRGPARVLTSIEQQANELGYSIFLDLLPEADTGGVEKRINNLRSRQVDGIICAIPEMGDNRAWTLADDFDDSIPIIFIGGMNGQTRVPVVAIDNRAIGRQATEHLIAGGAKHIGIITGSLNWWEAQQRLQGWRETLEEHGLAADERLIVKGDWSAGSGEQGLRQLLTQCPEVDAVFASNEQMALGVLFAASQLGRRVPEDISVVGVDNVSESAYFHPPLTTIRQDLHELGIRSVQILDQMIQNIHGAPRFDDGVDGEQEPNTIPHVVMLQPELVIRESSR